MIVHDIHAQDPQPALDATLWGLVQVAAPAALLARRGADRARPAVLPEPGQSEISQPSRPDRGRRTMLSMTALGIALLVLGAILIVVEAHVPSLGVLGVPGVAGLGVGAVLAVGGLGGGLALALIVALMLVVSAGAVLGVSLSKGINVRRRRISAGPESLIGHVGVVHSWEAPTTGKVLIDGALWRARLSWEEAEPSVLHEGDPIVVERRTGLTLGVRRAEEWELSL